MTGIDSFVVANGLRHHLVTWGEGDETVVLCHGFLDLAWSFEAVGERLARAGLRVVAFDFRGHGETEWIGAGGYYHFPDYTLDLEGVLDALGAPVVHLVGHSMGGTVASMYAGIRPGRVATLTLVEGYGPPPADVDDAPARSRAWMDGVARVRGKPKRPMASLDEAIERLRTMHGRLEGPLARLVAEKSTRPVEGGFVWRFDPLHQTTSPIPFRVELYTSFLRRIEAPTLVVLGEKGMRLPDERVRLAAIPDARVLELPEQGHMIHWFAPEVLADAVLEHVREDRGIHP